MVKKHSGNPGLWGGGFDGTKRNAHSLDNGGIGFGFGNFFGNKNNFIRHIHVRVGIWSVENFVSENKMVGFENRTTEWLLRVGWWAGGCGRKSVTHRDAMGECGDSWDLWCEEIRFCYYPPWGDLGFGCWFKEK